MHYWAAPRIFSSVDRRDAPLGLAELGRVDIVNRLITLPINHHSSLFGYYSPGLDQFHDPKPANFFLRTLLVRNKGLSFTSTLVSELQSVSSSLCSGAFILEILIVHSQAMD